MFACSISQIKCLKCHTIGAASVHLYTLMQLAIDSSWLIQLNHFNHHDSFTCARTTDSVSPHVCTDLSCSTFMPVEQVDVQWANGCRPPNWILSASTSTCTHTTSARQLATNLVIMMIKLRKLSPPSPNPAAFLSASNNKPNRKASKRAKLKSFRLHQPFVSQNDEIYYVWVYAFVLLVEQGISRRIISYLTGCMYVRVCARLSVSVLLFPTYCLPKASSMSNRIHIHKYKYKYIY